MTQPQAFAFAILIGLMIAFIWGRLRYDLIAVLALLAAVFTGIVPHKVAFSGFGDDIVIIVASALVVSAAFERSGVIEAFLHRVAPRVTSVQGQVVILVAAVTVLSVFIKNIGALAMMIPVAFQMARRSKASPSSFLMPMAFGSLLGGLITLVGTSPNIVVSRMREELTGQPFSMFDFTPVGIGIAAAGVVFLAFGYRLLPRDREAVPTMEKALNIKDYMTEARILGIRRSSASRSGICRLCWMTRSWSPGSCEIRSSAFCHCRISSSSRTISSCWKEILKRWSEVYGARAWNWKGTTAPPKQKESTKRLPELKW